MKSKFTLAVLASLLSACAQTPKAPESPPEPVRATTFGLPPTGTQAPAHPYAMPLPPPKPVVQPPSWYTKLPPDTADMTFAVGTASSTDEQMAFDKARMAAERKLVEQMYSRITTQTNSYRADRGQAMIENYQQVTRKNARGEIVGAQRVDSQVNFDGRHYKVYVLLRLPVGEANLVQTRRDQQRLQREADIRGRAAERDMDANEDRDIRREQEANTRWERSVSPPAPSSPSSQAQPAIVPTAVGEFKLLDVDNAEYRRRRDQALQKPGAVVGQMTVQ